MNNDALTFTGWLLAFLFFLLFLLATKTWSDVRADAVRNGWAHYEVDERGSSTLVWREAPDHAKAKQTCETKNP